MWGVREPEASITKRAVNVIPDAQLTLVVGPLNAMDIALILSRCAACAEITDGVVPAVLQQLLEPHRFEFIGPDAVGVWPRSVDRFGSDAGNSHSPLIQF